MVATAIASSISIIASASEGVSEGREGPVDPIGQADRIVDLEGAYCNLGDIVK